MRYAWAGTLGFGMVVLPVSFGSLIGDSGGIEFHQHAPDGSRIRYIKVAESTGREVAAADIRKGYSCPDGSVIFLTDADFDEAYGPVSREAKILQFTKTSSIPDIAKSKPYVVKPNKGGERAYALLALALRTTGTVAVVSFGVQRRKQLGALSATEDGYLLLEQLTWASDIRQPDFAAPAPELTEAEQTMAVALVEGLTEDFNHSAIADDSQEKLNALLTARIEGKQAIAVATAPPAIAPADLMAQLTASVAAIKKEPEVLVTATRPPRTRKPPTRNAA